MRKGRAGHYPGRMEAEDARLTGYKVIDVHPWEDASRGKAVVCQACSSFLPPDSLAPKLAAPRNGPTPAHAGRFDIAVQYFDLQGGVAHFALDVNGAAIASWAADRPHACPRGGPTATTQRDSPTRHRRAMLE